MKKLLVSATIVLGLIFTMFGSVLAKDPECKFNNGQDAWKIVNASGGLGDLQFETLEECQAYLDNPPTEPPATEPPTDVPTLEPTDVPTDEPALEPTEEPTEVVSTDEPTEIAPTEVATEVPVAPESGQKSRGRGNLCYRAYLILRFNQDKEPGYHIVREYPWCLVWMKLKYDFVPYIPPVE